MAGKNLDSFRYGAEAIGREAEIYLKDKETGEVVLDENGQPKVDVRKTHYGLEKGYIDERPHLAQHTAPHPPSRQRSLVTALNGVGPATAGMVDGARKVVVPGQPSSRTLTKPQDQHGIRAELLGSETCTACDITVGSYTPLLLICRALLDAGYDGDQALHVYRSNTLCMIVRSISEGASLEIDGKGCGFKHPAVVGIASPVRQNGGCGG